jgi:putative hydrolase
MPSAAKLQEAVRRRRAAGGPAESTFAALVGLELRPRRLRDASALWGSLRSRQGQQGRDAVWAHPDLLPTSSDLDDPLGFRERVEEPEALTDAEFDAALADLLDGEQDGPDERDS